MRFKENLQGISAGETGVIVIRDDFKAMTVEFIGDNGNAVRIRESPERLSGIVEVVEPTTDADRRLQTK